MTFLDKRVVGQLKEDVMAAARGHNVLGRVLTYSQCVTISAVKELGLPARWRTPSFWSRYNYRQLGHCVGKGHLRGLLKEKVFGDANRV